MVLGRLQSFPQVDPTPDLTHPLCTLALSSSSFVSFDRVRYCLNGPYIAFCNEASVLQLQGDPDLVRTSSVCQDSILSINSPACLHHLPKGNDRLIDTLSEVSLLVNLNLLPLLRPEAKAYILVSLDLDMLSLGIL